MFAKFSALFVAVALATGVVSAPTSRSNAISARSQSFDNWGGYSSLSGFDNFYGSSDFSHLHGSQTVVKEDSTLVCHSETVTIIQQRLAVLQEMAKKIITEQICEVETQTIVFQQYYSSLGSFSHDLMHYNNRQGGYDGNVVSHYGDMYNSDGSLSTYDFGFSGSDVGSNYYVPSNNWNSNSSPSSVGSAYEAAMSASSY
jgi:hypothetical protein